MRIYFKDDQGNSWITECQFADLADFAQVIARTVSIDARMGGYRASYGVDTSRVLFWREARESDLAHTGLVA